MHIAFAFSRALTPPVIAPRQKPWTRVRARIEDNFPLISPNTMHHTGMISCYGRSITIAKKARKPFVQNLHHFGS